MCRGIYQPIICVKCFLKCLVFIFGKVMEVAFKLELRRVDSAPIEVGNLMCVKMVMILLQIHLVIQKPITIRNYKLYNVSKLLEVRGLYSMVHNLVAWLIIFCVMAMSLISHLFLKRSKPLVAMDFLIVTMQ